MESEVEIKKRENILTNFNGGGKTNKFICYICKRKGNEIVFLTLTIKIFIYYAGISDSYNDLSSN